MTLGSAVKVLLRRWLVILIGLLLTLGAAGYLYLNTPPRYQATARMLLLLPADARGEEAVGSPFLYLPNGLNVLARIVATTPNSQDFHAQMVDRGLTSQYELGVDPTSPTLTVSVEGADPENVIETRDAVIATMQAELLRVQQEESAPTNQIARGRVYAAESTPEQISGDRMRGVLAVGGAGALLTLLMAFLIDRLIVLRKARKKRLAENPRPKKAKRAAAEVNGSPEAPDGENSAGATGVNLSAPIQDATFPDDDDVPDSNEDESSPADEDRGTPTGEVGPVTEAVASTEAGSATASSESVESEAESPSELDAVTETVAETEAELPAETEAEQPAENESEPAIDAEVEAAGRSEGRRVRRSVASREPSDPVAKSGR